MGLFSKIWKGVKKVVKGVAKGAKKVAKGLTTALPGGQKLWKLSGKIGKKVMGALGKLGPIGVMALSFVLGPLAGALWAGFGTLTASMAASASTLVSTLGTIGQGIFAAGNFIGGTLGALGNAVTEGASNVLAGNFSAGAQAFATNITNAFTGKAGMAAVKAGAAAANAAAFDKAVAAGNTAQAEVLSGRVSSSMADLQGMGELGQAQIAGMDEATRQSIMGADKTALQDMVQEGVNFASPAEYQPVDGGFDQIMADGQPLAESSQSLTQIGPEKLAELQSQGIDPNTYAQDMVNQYGATPDSLNALTEQTGQTIDIERAALGGKDLVGTPAPETKSVLDETRDRIDNVQNLFGGNDGGYAAQTAVTYTNPLQSAIPGATKTGGQGSAGFSLLDPVRGLKESLLASQQMLFS